MTIDLTKLSIYVLAKRYVAAYIDWDTYTLYTPSTRPHCSTCKAAVGAASHTL